MESLSLFLDLWNQKMIICGPKLVEEGSQNRTDCEGCPTVDSSYFLLQEGREQRDVYKATSYNDKLSYMWKICGRRTQSEYYLLPIGVELKHPVLLTNHPGILKVQIVVQVGLEILHFSQVPGEANLVGLGTMLLRVRL